MTVVPYARTIVVIGAHPTVVDAGITSEDLVHIYDKTRTQWQDGHDIVVLTREPGDSSLTTLAEAIPGFQKAYEASQQAKRWTTLHTEQEMHRVLAKTPYAIGFADLGAIMTERLPIKVLHVNGVAPTEEEVRNGRYALVRSLAFVFKQDKLSPAARAFIDFVQSAAGTAIIQASGYLPST
jgi:phosphate transport system substrate-binding protein